MKKQHVLVEFEKWHAIRASVGAWVACLHLRRASVGDLGGVLAWVAC